MAKLTKKEAEWVAKLQAVLDECPSDRIGFYTVGDPNLHVYDRSKDKKINAYMDANPIHEFCTAVDKVNASLGDLTFPSQVHSTAG